MVERRPHPARPLRGATRTEHTRRSTSAGEAHRHARGERILRDGRVERRGGSADRARVRPATRTAPARRRRPLGSVRLPLAAPNRRLHVVLVVMAMGLSLCAGRLLQLQGFDSARYTASSVDALTRTLPLLPARGDITDRNGAVLASTQPAVAVTADPTLTGPKAAQIAAILSPRLQMPVEQLIPLLTKPNTHFVYLKKKVPALTYSNLAAELSAAGIYGIFRESDPIRTYPSGAVGSSLVGFVGADGKGLAGLELSQNKELSGVEGTETYESAPNGSKIPLGQSSVTPAQNGLSYQLTIDSEIQWAAQQRLADQVKKQGADWGIAIVLNVKTGQVVAMANAPTFDSSNPQASDPEDRGNNAISSPYEPGSVEKVITAAALIDSGTATPDTKLSIPLRLQSGGGSIKDSFHHDANPLRYRLRGAIAKSSNIGLALLTRQMDRKTLNGYWRAFGMGSKTGIELPGESAGIIPPADMTNSQRDQAAFGQALAVTGIQEAAAIAGIVNGGIYNPPTIVAKATDASGNVVDTDDRTPRRIVSAKTSASVRDLMQAVIDSENGQNNLKLDAYTSGGKTGTAQRADPVLHRYKGYVTSYVGFAPLDDPTLLTYVVVNDPHKGDTGTSVAAPVYKDLMNLALPRYGVEPDARKHKPLPTTW